MDLLAHPEVRRAWQDVVEAEAGFEVWVEYDYGGDPDEEAPTHVAQRLDDALVQLRETCRRSLSTHRWGLRRPAAQRQ